MSDRPTLYVVVNNHFDPTWRRCFHRRFTWNGDTYVSYAEIEAAYMLENLALTRRHPEYRFEAESAIVARTFLERHPEVLPELQELARQRRFAVSGAGDNIIDTNLVTGESIVRNYLYGLLWVEKTFGTRTGLAVRNDGFGNSAQLPQILRGVEIAWVTGLSYTPVQGRYWRGLDGSTVLARTLPVVATGGGVIKYPPCPACRGVGCATCHGRGFDDTPRAQLPPSVDAATLGGADAGLATMTPEEYLPNPALVGWAAAQTGFEVRFALGEDVRPHVQAWLDEVDHPPADLVHPAVELNPNNTGVYATRIRTKQTVRRQEYALLGVETLAVMAALKSGAYPHEALRGVWQRLHFTEFHDAVTATHVDAAYAEIQDVWQRIDVETGAIREGALESLVAPSEQTVSVLNLTGRESTELVTARLPAGSRPLGPAGEPVTVVDSVRADDGRLAVTFLSERVPPFGAVSYRVGAMPAESASPLSTPVLESTRFRVVADADGLVSVFDKTLDRFVLRADGLRPGELLMEHDEGSPWATLHPDQTRTPLGPYTRLVAAEGGRGFGRLIFAVEMPWSVCFSSRGGVKGTITVTLVEGLDRVDFHASLDWACFNHRLRVAFPTPRSGRHLYGIPYGALERAPYAPWFGWTGANGDWPAIGWAGVQGEDCSVAVLDRGTPSYRIERGPSGGDVILVSVLRSPAVPTYLHEPEFYSMTGYDGMRDEGHHDVDLAVAAYGKGFDANQAAADAEGYAAGLLAVAGAAHLPAMPRLESGSSRITSVKLSEEGDALIVRIVEGSGRPDEAAVELPIAVTAAAKVNLLERRGEPVPILEGRALLALRPWEIATLRLEGRWGRA